MNRRHLFASLTVISLLLVVTQVLAGCAGQQSATVPVVSVTATSDTPMPPVGSLGGTDQGKVESSYRTTNSLQDLIAQSSLVVVGQLSSLGETINMARTPNDKTQPDPSVLVLGQVYQIAVERSFRGQGSQVLKVVQPEAVLNNITTPPSQANIDQAKTRYEHIPFSSGVRYLLFLRPLEGFPGKNYFVGTIHPWRFTLASNGNAQPESPWEGAKQLFPARPTTSLLAEVSRLVNIPNLSVEAKPSVATTQNPDIKPGQSVNVTQLYGLNTVQSIRLKGILRSGGMETITDITRIKSIVASLDKSVTSLEIEVQSQVVKPGDIIQVTFVSPDGKLVGFEYNRNAVKLNRYSTERFSIPAPADFAQILGLS